MSKIFMLFQVTVVGERFKALRTEEFLFSVDDRAQRMQPVKPVILTHVFLAAAFLRFSSTTVVFP